jgi:transcriptional regulator with XRE-family HTH domain
MGIDQLSTVQTPQTTAGVPELTALGKRIELLRIGRGLSKQHLAHHAGISRQQLWRVMSGKSELGASLRARLADALQVDVAELADLGSPIDRARPADLAAYVNNPVAIARTLSTMPDGQAGRSLKRHLLNALEDYALAHGQSLDASFFDLRRRVIAGEL